jgi:intraflagellar transport protein 56
LVNHYLTNHKESVVANNLKAAIEYNSTGQDKIAQSYLLALQEMSKSTNNLIEESDLLRHNMAVFDNDENSNTNKLKIFSSLIDIIPEAKLNLIIYYLRNDQVNQAYNLIKDIQPQNTKEYILKAVVHCLLGQQGDKNQEHLKKAQTYFQSIGASASECDTIEGRQCMASCFRLNGIFNDEIIYLESIETYMKDDDDFNWNYGIALGACQKYKEAEEVLSRIKKEKYKNDQVYLNWLCRCYIMNGKPEYAWNIYISIENHLIAVSLLSFIAHEFYRMGHFYYAFKAFLFFEKFSPSTENTNGKTSSAIGVFYQLVAGKIGSERLQEVIIYLSDGPQTEDIKKAIKVFKKWGKENGYNFSEQGVYDSGY